MIRLICCAHRVRRTVARAHGARLQCRLMSFVRTPANTRINFILPETRVPELHDSRYSMDLSVLYFLRNCLRKPRKDAQEER